MCIVGHRGWGGVRDRGVHISYSNRSCIVEIKYVLERYTSSKTAFYKNFQQELEVQCKSKFTAQSCFHLLRMSDFVCNYIILVSEELVFCSLLKYTLVMIEFAFLRPH